MAGGGSQAPLRRAAASQRAAPSQRMSQSQSQPAAQHGSQAVARLDADGEPDVRYSGVVVMPDPAAGVGHAGQIAKVHVENFMCHEHFEMELG